MRQANFAVDDEALRAYFPLPSVLNGLFELANRLFGIIVKEAPAPTGVWHEDVRYYEVTDARSGHDLAAFYLDPYSRPADKQGGAWMNSCLDRRFVCR